MKCDKNLKPAPPAQCAIKNNMLSALEWWNKLPMYNMDKPCKRVLSNIHYRK